MNMRGLFARFGVLFVLLTLAVQAHATEAVTMISPYDTPPFVVDSTQEKGLIYDLAALLSKRSQGKYKFKVKILPRSRLVRSLQNGKSFVVPLVEPKWFEDAQETRFLWTSSLYDDQNIVLSTVKKPLNYEGPNSLEGKKTTDVLGHRNPTLEDLAKQGKVNKGETSSLAGSLKMLASGRIDFVISGGLATRYLIKDLGLQGSIYISEKPMEMIHRKILVSPDNKSLFEWLDKEIKKLRESEEWKTLLKAYEDSLNSVSYV
ncbi:transporter substrate-binding domain-containing protein [Bdellovibrio sp. 22V]|uniref:substrate-binding periplasmic protein n=1 Tax=Bdellovibrio TaxID=958 RepID=UPI002542AC4F|nr:transporter substrate-binding domain-containing protein [Bdellovibrio sp. 22V]WII73563.1 transporter substrate-binding domain-containing protein [Bdellovibrio sp. 22V]